MRDLIDFITHTSRVFCLIALTGSSAFAPEELGEIAPLAAMDVPGERQVGWQWHYVDSIGKPGYMEKVAGDDVSASYERTDGCHWTRPV